MMKRFFGVFLFFIITSSFTNIKENEDCFCLDFYNYYSNIRTIELIELRTVIKMVEISESINIFHKESQLKDKLFINTAFEENPSGKHEIAYAKPIDTIVINEALVRNKESFKNLKFIWSFNASRITEDTTSYHTLYAYNTIDSAGITSKDIIESRINLNNKNDGITIRLNRDGYVKWNEFSTKNIGNLIAVIGQNKVLSTAMINGPMRGGEIRIGQNLNEKELEQYCNFLNCNAYMLQIGEKAFEEEIKKCK